MRDYGKVFSTFWSSATTAGMTDDGKLLALYLMTCSHSTIAGVFRLPDGYVSEDLAWSIERVQQGFSELLSKGFANRCETTKWVWVVKHLEWNPPENPNQRKSAVKIATSIPRDTCWIDEFMRVCGAVLALATLPLLNPSGTVGKGLPNQEQKQKQKQEQKQELDVGAASAPPPVAPATPTPPAAPAAATPRGTRLAADWRLPKAWGDAALTEYPLWTPERVRLEGERFRDHWASKTGKDATKLDWQATWRNWYRDPLAHRDDPKPPRGIVTDASLAAANAASTEDARRRLFGNHDQETIDA
jgi:hypothetical protein